ncbi:MAG: hypothetical protein KDC44_14940, partial [Phaeodactylibacter sp.]|nr:hypothetical protein [Phaeodactylibacter sp.]
MKQLFSIFLAFILLTPSLLKIGVYVDFKIRQDYIAEVLCVNRAEPVNLCSGACYLDTQLKQ